MIVEEALKELVITIFELAASYGVYEGKSEFGINIDFDDGVFESQDSKANYYGKLTTLQLTSKRRAIQKILGVTEKEAKEIIVEIQEEAEGLDSALIEDEKIDTGTDIPGINE